MKNNPFACFFKQKKKVDKPQDCDLVASPKLMHLIVKPNNNVTEIEYKTMPPLNGLKT